MQMNIIHFQSAAARWLTCFSLEIRSSNLTHMHTYKAHASRKKTLSRAYCDLKAHTHEDDMPHIHTYTHTHIQTHSGTSSWAVRVCRWRVGLRLCRVRRIGGRHLLPAGIRMAVPCRAACQRHLEQARCVRAGPAESVSEAEDGGDGVASELLQVGHGQVRRVWQRDEPRAVGGWPRWLDTGACKWLVHVSRYTEQLCIYACTCACVHVCMQPA